MVFTGFLVLIVNKSCPYYETVQKAHVVKASKKCKVGLSLEAHFHFTKIRLSWIVGIQGLLSVQDTKCNPVILCKHYLRTNLVTMHYLCLELVTTSKITVLICVFCGGSELTRGAPWTVFGMLKEQKE